MNQNQINPDDMRPTQRGIYLLPNIFTTATLFAGFYAIVSAMKGSFEVSAVAIFVAIIADSLDGRIARMTHTQTAFGAEYDSMCDLAAFGIAPALVLYAWSLYGGGKFGWLAAFLYTAATALRLARFNTQINDKKDFQGLPSPAAAGLVASIVWMGANYDISGLVLIFPLGLVAVILSVLMVSTIRYSSFKSFDFKGKVPFLTVVIALFFITAIALEPAEMLLAIFSVYICSGPVMTFWRLRQIRSK